MVRKSFRRSRRGGRRVRRAKVSVKPDSLFSYRGSAARNYRFHSYARNTMTNRFTGMVGSRLNYMGKCPLATKYTAKLKYVSTFSMSTGAAGIMGTQQTMSLNSLFDPDQTGVGHQPYGFDQLAALYNRYRVFACKVELIWTTIGATAEMCCAYIINPDVGGLAISGISTDRAVELPMISSTVLSPSGRDRVTKQTFYTPLHKVFGIKKATLVNDDKYQALVTADPLTQGFLNFAVGSYSGAAGETCSCQVVMTFYAQFFDRIVQAQS